MSDQKRYPWVVIFHTLAFEGTKCVAVEVLARHDQEARMRGVFMMRDHYPDNRRHKIVATSGISDEGVLLDNAVMDYKPEDILIDGQVTEYRADDIPDSYTPNPEGIRTEKPSAPPPLKLVANNNLRPAPTKRVTKPPYERAAMPMTAEFMTEVAESGITFYDTANRVIVGGD
jgi:hypothetical protein